MDFYQHQHQAKQLSFRLLALFLLGLIVLSVALSLLSYYAWVVTHHLFPFDTHSPAWRWFITGNILLLLTLCVITLFKYLSLCRGGQMVAKALGGRYIPVSTQDAHERRLRNVVEEMALASGVPVPSIFVLDEEPCINAFAAGMSIHDAVIAVTHGTLMQLTRDELQAVIAHEFSHIVHGDIRINQQLAALIGSLTFIGEIGRFISTSSPRRRSMRISTQSSSSSHGKDATWLYFTGLLLVLLGFIGSFWGKLMQASVSRQREFLADASAVQFTRQSLPLADALKKVGGAQYASLVFHPKAEQFGHLFFSQGLTKNFRGKLASHPPLKDRIQRLDPAWDGRYITPVPVEIERIQSTSTEVKNELTEQAPEVLAMMAAQSYFNTPPATNPRPVETVTTFQNHGGQDAMVYDKTAQHEWLPLIPQSIRDALHQTEQAKLVIFALLFARQSLRAIKPAVFGEFEASKDYQKYSIPEGLQFAVVELAIPALKEMPHDAYDQFKQKLDQTIHNDDQCSLEEWLIATMLTHALDLHFKTTAPRPMTPYRDLVPVISALNTLLSFMATQATSSVDAAHLQFASYQEPLKLSLTYHADVSFEALELAIAELQNLSTPLKFTVMQAVVRAIELDGKITPAEAGLFQMLAFCLDCPLPPPTIWH